MYTGGRCEEKLYVGYVCKGEWLYRVDGLVGRSLACILPCSSISLSPPNPLTLCLKISRIISLLSPGSRGCSFSYQQLHQQVEKCPSQVHTLHQSKALSTSPPTHPPPWQWNATPHIFKVYVLNFLLTESCFHVSCSGMGRGGIIYYHSTHSNAESTESQDKRVRTAHRDALIVACI